MHPVGIARLAPAALGEPDDLHRTTRDARRRTRAQMVLLAAEQGLPAAETAAIVRASAATVRRWLKRYRSEGIAGLHDAPRPGTPRKVTAAYVERLLAAARRRPRSMGLPFSLRTLRRLADHLAEETGIRGEYEAVRLPLKAAGIVPSRPQHTITSPAPEYALQKRRSKAHATASNRARTFTTPTGST
jgi:transposase